MAGSRFGEEENLSHAQIIQRDVEKGVVTVASEKHIQFHSEPETSLLSQIPKFEPLVKLHPESSGYGISSFWGSNASESEVESSFKHESLSKIFATYQSYMRRCAEEICEDQRVVIETVRSVEKYCTEASQSTVTTQTQAKANLEQIGVVNSLMKQVEKTHKLVYDIFQKLNAIDKLLPPDIQLGDASARKRWPTAHKLYGKVRPKPAQHGGSFQFETKRLSLQQRRTHPSVVSISFDNVLSARHQELPRASTLSLSPNRSSILQAALPGNSESFTTDGNLSDKSKVIYTNRTEQLSSNDEGNGVLGLNLLRDGIKKVDETATDNLFASTLVSSPSTSPSDPSTEGLQNNMYGTAGSTFQKSKLNNNHGSSPSQSVSLLTAMLRRSSVRGGEKASTASSQQ